MPAKPQISDLSSQMHSLSINQNLPVINPGRPWQFEEGLLYSRGWWDKGTYRLHELTNANQPDFKFVQTHYKFNPLQGYEIADITLLADERDEQAFVAGLDLLQKKHGNPKHKAKWGSMPKPRQSSHL